MDVFLSSALKYEGFSQRATKEPTGIHFKILGVQLINIQELTFQRSIAS